MDAVLRGEERKASQGDVQAQGAVLANRVRSGDLDRGCLELCAYLGHDPALAVCKPPVPPDFTADFVRAPTSIAAWVLGLGMWPKLELLRCFLAMVRLALTKAGRNKRPCRDALVLEAFRRAQDTALGRNDGWPSADYGYQLSAYGSSSRPVWMIGTLNSIAAHGAAGSSSQDSDKPVPRGAGGRYYSVDNHSDRHSVTWAAEFASVGDYMASLVDENALKEAARNEVVPWLLGECDPLGGIADEWVAETFPEIESEE